MGLLRRRWRPMGLLRRRWRPIGLRRLVPLLQLLRRVLGFRHNGGTRPGNRGFAVRA